MQAIRLAAPHFLNTLPLIQGLEKLENLTIQRAAPSDIASLVAQGNADLGLASIVDAPRENLTVLDAGMIGCAGQTLTVRLFSRVPFEKVTALYADTDSHTSIILAQLILQESFHVKPAIVPLAPKAALPPDAHCVLLIGDKAITQAPSQDDYPHQLDLGEAWHDATKLPFVYAAWMCKEMTDRVQLASSLITRQLRHNMHRLDTLAHSHAPRAGWNANTATSYMRGLLRYELTPSARAGAELFLTKAHAAGLIPAPAIRWAN